MLFHSTSAEKCSDCLREIEDGDEGRGVFGEVWEALLNAHKTIVSISANQSANFGEILEITMMHSAQSKTRTARLQLYFS
jgi:hypothetical protein